MKTNKKVNVSTKTIGYPKKNLSNHKVKPTSKTKKVNIDWDKLRMQQKIKHLEALSYVRRGEYGKAVLTQLEIPEELLKIISRT